MSPPLATIGPEELREEPAAPRIQPVWQRPAVILVVGAPDWRQANTINEKLDRWYLEHESAQYRVIITGGRAGAEAQAKAWAARKGEFIIHEEIGAESILGPDAGVERNCRIVDRLDHYRDEEGAVTQVKAFDRKFGQQPDGMTEQMVALASEHGHHGAIIPKPKRKQDT